MRLFAPTTVKMCGHVCTIRLVATKHKPEGDDDILNWLKSHESSFEAEVREEVTAALGPQFVIKSIEYREGSVEVSLAIATVGVVYVATSRYKNFVESIGLLTFHLRKVLHRFCGPMDSHVSAGWEAGTALDSAASYPDATNSTSPLIWVLVCYLVLTNAALIAVMVWMSFSGRPF